MGNSVFRFFWTCNVIFRGCKFRTAGLKLSAKSDPVHDGQEGVACSSKVYAGRAVRADLAGWCIPVCRKWLQLNNHGGLAVVWQKWQLPEITTSALFSCTEVWTPLLRRADKAFHRGCKALFVPCVLSQEEAVLQAAWEACSPEHVSLELQKEGALLKQHQQFNKLLWLCTSCAEKTSEGFLCYGINIFQWG